MLVTIPDLINPTELDAVQSVLRQAQFVDGRRSAGKHARPGKRNEELAPSAETLGALNNVVMTRLVQHPTYLQCALPAKISVPIYARYTAGMKYDGHIDDPLMGAPDARYRADISVTVFLNAPEEYSGGELCIESADGVSKIKLAAGYALLYPSNRFHSVNQVTDGERLVAITWVQSLVRLTEQREILVQLDRARQALQASGDHQTFRQVELSYANLLRMWAEF